MTGKNNFPEFDVVIATRNRAKALSMSIPLILNQSVKPKSLIIVDSSDNHEEVCKAVEGAVSGFKGKLEIIKSARGTTLQRNVGLNLVKEEIVFFPDDDSMFHPGASEETLKIYRADTAKAVGGVCTAEAFDRPGALTTSVPYKLSVSDYAKLRLLKFKRAFERNFAPCPMMLLGHEYIASRSAPEWLSQHNAVLVESMTGFRMTFRTEAIARAGFEETFVNYGLHEDIDASLSVLKHQHLVGARNAKIYHHRFPGARSSGRFYGVAQLLNRAYLIAKHAPPNSSARGALFRYNAYTVARYSLETLKSYGRGRFLGALAAAQCAEQLLRSAPEDLATCYRALWRQCIATE